MLLEHFFCLHPLRGAYHLPDLLHRRLDHYHALNPINQKLNLNYIYVVLA